MGDWLHSTSLSQISVPLTQTLSRTPAHLFKVTLLVSEIPKKNPLVLHSSYFKSDYPDFDENPSSWFKGM